MSILSLKKKDNAVPEPKDDYARWELESAQVKADLKELRSQQQRALAQESAAGVVMRELADLRAKRISVAAEAWIEGEKGDLEALDKQIEDKQRAVAIAEEQAAIARQVI